MRTLDWHTHRGDPCAICGCGFKEQDESPQATRRRELEEQIEDAEGLVAALQTELDEARDCLNDLERELSRMDRADRSEVERMQQHPWMLAREACPA